MNIANVLVVDDDPAMCRIVKQMLSSEHCKVETSLSVAEAIKVVEQKSFDAYVMDYKLPDGSGIDVAKRIRSKWGAAPSIILMSGYQPSEVAVKAEKLSISDFLEKPFSRERISNVVKKAIDSAQANLAPTSIKDPSPEDLDIDRRESPLGRIRSAMARLVRTRQS